VKRRTRAPAPLAPSLAALLLTGNLAAAAEPPEEDVYRYADAGTSEVNVLLGASSRSVVFGGGFRHFVLDQVAPGLEAVFTRADGVSQAFVFPSLRVVPLRLASFALVVTARAGRVFLSDHIDGWAYGGDAGVLIFFSRHVGLEIGYEVLKLAPASFCRDLTDCLLRRPVVGVRIGF
jgi:hypothetical protein